MTHINEMNLGFDDETKTLTDLEALEMMLQKPEHRACFLEQIDTLVKQKEILLSQQESYKNLISSTKEAFRFKTAAFINSTVDSIVKDKLSDNIALSVAEADLLTVVKEHLES